MNEEDQLSSWRRCMKEAEAATPTWEQRFALLKPGSKEAVQAENDHKKWISMTPQQRSNKLYWDDMLNASAHMVLMVPITTIAIVIAPFALTYSTIKKKLKI